VSREAERGQVDVLPGLQHQRHEPVKRAIVRVARAGGREQHGGHRREHQDAGQVAQAEGRQQDGRGQPRQRGGERHQLTLDDPAGQPGDWPVVTAGSDPARVGQAGIRPATPGPAALDDCPPRGDRAPGYEGQEGGSRTPHQGRHRDHGGPPPHGQREEPIDHL
jgi:hypothetical protein